MTDARRIAILHAACVLLLIAAVVPVVTPFLHDGFPQGHDTAAHLANLFRFDRAFQQGQHPVRWVDGLAPGHGQPLFNFYQVGFYYAVEGIHGLGLPLSTAFKLTPVALWWLATLFVFLWLRPFGVPAAAAGTISFALSPYVIVDVFVRAAYPEFSALVWTVGSLWAADSFLRSGRPSRGLLFALGVAFMLLSHLPATLIVFPAIVVEVVAVGLIVQWQPRRVAMLAGAAALGAGVAAFYVGPAILELDVVQINGLTVDSTDFHRHFVPASLWTHYLWSYEWNYFGTSVSDPTTLMPVHISLVQWAGAIGSGAIAIAAVLRGRARKDGLVLGGWLLVMLLGMFMMHRTSTAVWEAAPLLRFIQFPWRFFLLVSIAGAPLVAACVARIGHRTLASAIAIGVLIFHMHFYDRRLRPDRDIAYAQMAIDVTDWADRLNLPSRAYEESSYDPVGAPRDAAPAHAWTVLSGRAIPQVIRRIDTDLQLRVESVGDSRVQINMPTSPGWTTTVDGTRRADPPVGYPTVDLADGVHLVRRHLVNTWIQTVSNWITIGSCLLLAAIGACLIVLPGGGARAASSAAWAATRAAQPDDVNGQR